MALVVADRVQETTTTTGTGTYTLAGAKDGFQSFAAVGNGNTTYYACTDGTDYEIGIGTYTASGTTLARTTIIESSNSDTAVNWGAGEKNIFVTLPASKAIFEDASNNVAVGNNITVGGTVDGRDVAADGSKLDNIEANADVTDATNVQAAGALMDSEVTNLAQVKAFDSADYATAAQGTTADNALPKAGGQMTGNITMSGAQTVDGRDLSVDGSKLDGIEAGATADQTAAEILTAIKTVDGAGSGLDADTLDGLQSGSFLRSDTSDTIAGNLTVDNGTSSSIIVQSDDTGTSGIYLRGNTQGTGFVEVGQSTTYGGGLYYNGDGSPAFASGESSDTIGFYRLSGGTRTEVFSYPHNSNQVTFNGNIAVGGTVDGRDVAADGTKLDGIESGATADQTITAGSGLTGGGTGDVTISHADTSTQASVNGSGRTYIQDITLDTYGHVTAIGTATETVTDTTNFNIQANSGTQVNISAGEEINFINGDATTAVVTNQTNPTVTFNHNDTSSQASVNNSNGTVIQDVTLDGYGHVTALGSVDLDSRYVNITGDTMTGRLILPDGGYSIGDEYHTWKRSYVVNTTSPQELLYHDGNSLPSGGAYRFHAHIAGTGTDQSATAVYWNQNGTWKVNVTYQSGTSSNHPEFIIGGSPEKPQIHIDHSSNYTIEVLGERLELSESIGTDNLAGFGTDAFLGSVSGTLRYNDAGSANDYTNGNIVFHDGYHPNADKWTTGRTIALTGDVTGTSGSFDGSANLSFSTAIASGVVGANELNVTGNGTTAQFLRSDGDGSFTWATPTNTNQLTTFQVEDGDGTEVTISHAKEWKFVEGAGSGASIDINWTDTSTGSDADPYDLTFAVTNTDKGSSQNIFKTFTISDTDSGYTWAETGSVVADSNSDTVTFVSGNAIDIDVDATNDAIKIAHADTSSQASLTALTGANVVSDIDVDGFGHVTNLATRAMTLGDLGYTGETNATADQTASEILTAIKTVDGAGSGLDADTLDGVQGSNFLRSNVSDTATGRMTFTNGLVLSGNAGDANSSQLIVSDIAPQIKLLDTDTTHDDFWIHVDSNNFYVLADRNDSDGWSTPHPLQLEADTDTGYMFGQRVFTDSYHPNADVWTTGRTIALTGDVTGTSGSFNGSGNLSFSTNIASNVVGANELNVSGNGTTSQFLRSDGDGTFTWATPTDTNTTYSAGSGISLSGTTFSHSDTSSQASVNNSGNTFIQDITVDTYGHITALTSATATASANDDIFWENGQTVSSNYTITNGKNAMSAGPITIGSGVTVTVGDGETWTVV